MLRLMRKVLTGARAGSGPLRSMGYSPLVTILFLSLSIVGRESALMASLRGESRVEDDLRQGAAKGYYENLLDVSNEADPDPGAEAKVAGATPEPGAVIPFRDAGIVDEVPGFVRWRMRPNLEIAWNATTFRTNSHGYRTPEFSTAKPEGTYRVVCFGSSNTMGHGVEEEVTYPRLFEGWLRERLGDSRKVEVLNLAVSGDSPARRLERLREEGAKVQADWFLCEASALDYLLEEEHLQMVLRKRVPVPYDFLREALDRAGVSGSDSNDSFHRKFKGESEGVLDGVYAGWASESRRLGVPLAVAILPRSDRKALSPRMFRLMRDLASRNGLESFDLSEAFVDLNEAQMQVSRWDNHPSVLGHRRIFERLRDDLERRGGLPGLPFPEATAAR
ncbi:SGNH/GDSL hydrolase family protein [Singulisphaera sp. PoT]|uniref:SGNH/GDSL hydrolase family protein n=1 Tax=Singulisphaera sp. PoT TaxID=3411797 RepID=UPI003BF53323